MTMADRFNEIYRDRADAGRRLASALKQFAGRGDVVVLGLPRGGVVVAGEVAQALHAPLDVLVVRKLGVPWQPELAFGAIADGGGRVLNREVIDACALTEHDVEQITRREMLELHRRRQVFRGDRPAIDVTSKCVILIDDGLATGSTMSAAVIATRDAGASQIIVAVPVAPPATVRALAAQVDQVVCPMTPEPFAAIGQWYEQFDQVEDEAVCAILRRAWTAPSTRASTPSNHGVRP